VDKNMNNRYNEQEIIKMYEDGLSTHKIGKLINTYDATILRILKRNNIKIRKDFKNPAKEEIIKMYNYGHSLDEVGKKFNLSGAMISIILEENNIKLRNKFSYTPINNKLNYNFFNKINNEASAYFLGLMFADGCNSRTIGKNRKSPHYKINIGLQEADWHILETFKSFIAPGYNLRFIDVKKKNKKWKQKYVLEFVNEIIGNQLNSLGCVPAKSLILTYPHNHISDHLHHHFIRGYFDGDGCITSTLRKSGTRKYQLHIASTKSFCDSIGLIIKSFMEINYGLILADPKSSNKITHKFQIGGNNQIYKFMSWLYKDATIFLSRKHDKFLALEKQIKELETKKHKP
jgi:intein-encoded DNA endonuclease-like protein